MKTLPLYAALLLALATPAMAASPPARSTVKPDDRAEMQREMTRLQRQINELASRMGKLSARLYADYPRGDAYSRGYAVRYLANPDHGMLGLVLQPGAKGLQVAAVTPGSPAERAGIGAGDIIIRVDGKPVKATRTRADNVLTTVDGKDIEFVRTPSELGPLGDVKVGAKVRLDVLHEGKQRSVTLRAERHVAPSWYSVTLDKTLPKALSDETLQIRLDDADKALGRLSEDKAFQVQLAKLGRDDTTQRIFLRELAPWWGLNLASLNPDLAGYFGTRRGALVLSSQAKRYPGLKGGDVITAVDGKAVDSPEDVMRALRGRSEGTPVKLSVRRHGGDVTVAMKAPSPQDAVLPPLPPAPPATPTPPPAPALAPPPPPAPPAAPTPDDGAPPPAPAAPATPPAPEAPASR